MNRTPRVAVQRELRREVGFGCPIPGCGRPYLQWHHFDPPWRERQHHEPAGMIALCQEHHDKADAGTFTREQLRELKEQGAARAGEIRGQLDWMRRDLLAVVGGNMYYNTPIIFHFHNQPIIWFRRDEDGYMLLNVNMLSTSEEPRMEMRDNFWLEIGSPEDLESPPNGKLLRVKYSNGDFLEVRFLELDSASTAAARYSEWQIDRLGEAGVNFPLTAVEVHNRVADTDIEFGPRGTTLPGALFTGSVFIGGLAAIVYDSDDDIFSDVADPWQYDPSNTTSVQPLQSQREAAIQPQDNIYNERVIRLSELAGDRGILDGFEFRGCDIKGPAVLVLQDNTLTNCNLGGDADAILWEVPPSRTRVIGAILAKDCVFDGCTFMNVGFAGPPDFTRQIRDGLV